MAHVDQAEEALEAAEVPVGCVFVRNGEAIAKARNRTNEWRNVSIVRPYQTAFEADRYTGPAGHPARRAGFP
jgi:hypothetical protein